MIKGGSHLLQEYQRSEWCRCKRPIVFGKEFELCVLPVRKSLRVLDFLLFSVFSSSSFVFFFGASLFSLCSLYHLLRRFRFASLLSLVADSVILLFRLGDTPPLRCLRVWSMRNPLACHQVSSFLRSCVLAVDLLFNFCSLSFFSISILDIVCLILSFSCRYYAVSSVSVCDATTLACVWYISWFVRTLISRFISCLLYTICFSYFVYILSSVICCSYDSVLI